MSRLIERYTELYDSMAQSQDVGRMRAFGEVERIMYAELVVAHPEVAEKWLSRLEARSWNNYLSEHEALVIAEGLVHQDGSRGAKWTIEQVKEVASSAGIPVSEPPFYNEWALYVTANMIASDHWVSLSEVVPSDNLPALVTSMAVEKLKDPDRKEFVRSYFEL